MCNRKRKVTILVACGLIVGPACLLGDYVLSWHTIDGGGDMFCTGGGYELSGTAGQPDASTTILAGGGYELTGGFWKPARQAPDRRVVPPGDGEPPDHDYEQVEEQPPPLP